MDTVALWEEEIANEKSHYFENLWTNIDYLCESIDMDNKLINEDVITLTESVWETIKEKIIGALNKIKEFFTGLIDKIKGFIKKDKIEIEKLKKEKEENEKKSKEEIKKAKEEFEEKKKEIQSKLSDSEAYNRALEEELDKLKEKIARANKIKNYKDKMYQKLKKEHDNNKIQKELDKEAQEEAREKLKELYDKNKPVYNYTFRDTNLFYIDYVKDLIQKIENKDHTDVKRWMDDINHNIEMLKDDNKFYDDNKLSTLKRELTDPINLSIVSNIHISTLEFMNIQNETLQELNQYIDKINTLLSGINDADAEMKDFCITLLRLIEAQKQRIKLIIKENLKTTSICKQYIRIVMWTPQTK